MKARIIRTDKDKLRLLCEDGTLSTCSGSVLYNFLVNFKTTEFVDGTAGRWDAEYPDMSIYPGKSVAHISDHGQLIIYDFEPFTFMISENPEFVEYLSTEEYAKLHNVSSEMIKVYCRKGRIAGARKVGERSWSIPETAPYPVDSVDRKPTSGRTPVKKKR